MKAGAEEGKARRVRGGLGEREEETRRKRGRVVLVEEDDGAERKVEEEWHLVRHGRVRLAVLVVGEEGEEEGMGDGIVGV